MDQKTVDLTVSCNTEEAEAKASHLVELLKEASALVDELASKGINIRNDSFVPEDSNGKLFKVWKKGYAPN